MKNIKLIFCCTVLFLTSCISTKKVTDVVTTKVQDEFAGVKAIKTNYLVLNTEKLGFSDDIPATTDKFKSYFIPALVYWDWEHTLSCNINNRYFSNIFAEILTEKALEIDLKNQLAGKRLEITLENVPRNFVYRNYGFVVFMLFFYSFATTEAIEPFGHTFSVSYALFQNENIVKDGYLYIEDTAPATYNRAHTTKKFIGSYVDTLSDTFILQSEDFIDRIFDEVLQVVQKN